jgi:hypothetical protein
MALGRRIGPKKSAKERMLDALLEALSSTVLTKFL